MTTVARISVCQLFAKMFAMVNDGRRWVWCPLEEGTLTMETLRSVFPNTIGLVYQTDCGMCAVRIKDSIFFPPPVGWGASVFKCITNSVCLRFLPFVNDQSSNTKLFISVDIMSLPHLYKILHYKHVYLFLSGGSTAADRRAADRRGDRYMGFIIPWMALTSVLAPD